MDDYRQNKLKRGNKRTIILFIVMIFSLLVFFVLDLITGSVSIPGREVLAVVFGERESEWVAIIMQFRVPRAITAMLAGMALSVSGLQMQTVFRNPLAGPYVLGISSGASLGVALLILGSSSFITFSNSIFAGNWAIIAAAWIGSGLVLLLIMVVSLRVRDIMTVLILGIMFASAISAIVSIMQYFSSESSLKTFVIWTMGSLGNLSWDQLKILLLGVLLGLSLCFMTVKKLNALLLGEEYAKSVGLDVKPARIIIFISTSMLAGSVTAFCGPIGFIGIAVPHITRLLLKTSSHNYLVPGTMLMGGIILLAGDIISQVPGSERILPINSVTALIGIPIMVWIIVRKNKLISIS